MALANNAVLTRRAEPSAAPLRAIVATTQDIATTDAEAAYQAQGPGRFECTIIKGVRRRRLSRVVSSRGPISRPLEHGVEFLRKTTASSGFADHNGIIVIPSIARILVMPNVLVRNLDDGVLKELKAAAKAHGRSLQAEIHDVLRNASARRLAGTRRLSAQWMKRLRGSTQSDSTALIREDRDAR